MVDPTYCIKALRRGICTDSSCPMRHDITRCEVCDCSFPHFSLSQHQSGKQHLRNVASTASGPQQSPFSKMTSNIWSAPPANISPPAGVNIPTCDTDPRINVSGEGGLYFFVEGSGTPGNPLFSVTNRNILIEKTNLSSSLSFQCVALTPPLGSWCELVWLVTLFMVLIDLPQLYCDSDWQGDGSPEEQDPRDRRVVSPVACRQLSRGFGDYLQR
jgi:hypothetical protein